MKGCTVNEDFNFLSNQCFMRDMVSRYKWLTLTTWVPVIGANWVPGAGAISKKNFIQAKLGKAPVCSALITQANINSINSIN